MTREEKVEGTPPAAIWRTFEAFRGFCFEHGGTLRSYKEFHELASKLSAEIALAIPAAPVAVPAEPRQVSERTKRIREHQKGSENITPQDVADAIKRGDYAVCRPAPLPPPQEPEMGEPAEYIAVENFLNRDFEISMADTDYPQEWPEEMSEKPVARIRWYEDSGDSSVGMPGWSGFCLVTDQSGTWLGEALSKSRPTALAGETRPLVKQLREYFKEWSKGWLFDDPTQLDLQEEGHHALATTIVKFLENDEDGDEFSQGLAKIVAAAASRIAQLERERPSKEKMQKKIDSLTATKHKLTAALSSAPCAMESIYKRDDLLEDWCESWNDLTLSAEKRAEIQRSLFKRTNDLWPTVWPPVEAMCSKCQAAFAEGSEMSDDLSHKYLDRKGVPREGRGLYLRIDSIFTRAETAEAALTQAQQELKELRALPSQPTTPQP